MELFCLRDSSNLNLQLNKTSSSKSNLFRGIKGFKHSKCSSVEANIHTMKIRRFSARFGDHLCELINIFESTFVFLRWNS
jgi:hypothetical protein